MKLIFVKDKEGDIVVMFKNGEAEEAFSYSEMVKRLYDEKSLENAELKGDFTPEEKESISKLIEEIRTVILSKEEDEE